MTTNNKRLIMILALLLIVPVILIGCTRTAEQPAPRPVPSPEPTQGVEPEPTPEPEPAPAPSGSDANEPVLLYFVRGEKIGVGGRSTTASDVQGRAKAAVEGLVAGPSATEKEFGLTTAIPDGTRLLGLTVSGNTATVDLSGAFQSGGGSLSMQMRVAQVVHTLTQFEGIDRVAFKLDGKSADAIGGEGVEVGPSVTRADVESMAPSVLVERPYVGEVVRSPLTVTGTSNTFEATHQFALTDPDGLILDERYITATSGTGTRGTWSTTVEFSPKRDGLGAVIVFEYSAKDGKRINVVEIPVEMKR